MEEGLVDARTLKASDVPVVVEAALNGDRERSDSAAIPITDEEIVADALAAWDAGAAVIHLHARDRHGTRAVSVDRYAAIAEGIRAGGCDAVLNIVCGAHEDRPLELYECLRLRPELVSLDDGMPGDDLADVERWAERLRRLAVALVGTGTAPQIRCATAAQVLAVLKMRDEGLLCDPLRFQLVLGADGAPATIEHALYMRSLVPDDAIWSICASGTAQLRLNVLCLLAGGHIRTGLADNTWLVEDVPATNCELVARVVRIVDELDRPLATPTEARETLRLHDANAPRLLDEHEVASDRRDQSRAA